MKRTIFLLVLAGCASTTRISPPSSTSASSTSTTTSVAPVASTLASEAIVCRDGYIWPSKTRQGACSHHGGIAP